MAVATGLTIDDFEKLPDILALNHELVDGELVDVSGNTPEHNLLRDLLVSLLRPAAKRRAAWLHSGAGRAVIQVKCTALFVCSLCRDNRFVPVRTSE